MMMTIDQVMRNESCSWALSGLSMSPWHVVRFAFETFLDTPLVRLKIASLPHFVGLWSMTD